MTWFFICTETENPISKTGGVQVWFFFFFSFHVALWKVPQIFTKSIKTHR